MACTERLLVFTSAVCRSPLLPVEKLFPDMPTDDQTALWTSKEEVYRLVSTKLTPLPGLLAFLSSCEVAGLAMIIVTNAPRIDAVHTLKVLGLSDRRGSGRTLGVLILICCRAREDAVRT